MKNKNLCTTFIFSCRTLFLITFMLPFSVTAVELVGSTHDDLFFSNEVPIVLSATRLAQPQTEAPASITIIDRQLIKLSGATQIPELFRLVPGMQVGYFRGNKPVVSYQGLTGEFSQGVQVLIDGRAVYSPVFGGIDWANFPLNIEDIERIEVVRGPNSSSFGSNAFQSVINITTIHSEQQSTVRVKTTVGERGYQRNLIQGGFAVGEFNMRLSGSHSDDNGYANNDDDSRQDMLTARIDFLATPQDSFQINLSTLNTLRETVNPRESFDPTDPLRNKDESQHSIHGKWEHTVSPEEQFTTQLSYTHQINKDKVSTLFTDTDFGLGEVVFNADMTEEFDRWNFEFEHQFKPSESTRLSWGIGLRSDRVSLPFWTGTEQKLNNFFQRVFSNLEWRPNEHFIINAGALFEHSDLAGSDFAPRLAVNYLPSSQHGFRFIASRAFRTPVLVEEKFNTDLVFTTQNTSVAPPIPAGTDLIIPAIRGAANIQPETVDSIELGYHGLFINNKLTIDLKLFRNSYKNLINNFDEEISDAVTLGGMPIASTEINFVDNLFRATTRGYEVELNYRPDRKNLLHIGYAYHHTNSQNDDLITSVPKDSINLLAAHTFENDVWGSLAFYYTSSMEYLTSGNPQGPLRRLDLNAGKSISLGSKQTLDLKVSLQLALDKNKDFLSQFNVDNRAFIEASYSFD